jgi:hypothetical protein
MGDFGFYFRLGWEHIISIDALDHILFILALISVYRWAEWRRVLILVTAFTIGHSVTLALSSLNLVSLSSDWVEFLIPCTIVFTAASNLFLKTYPPGAVKWNYLMASGFGLIHGFGFANTLRFILAEDQNFGWSLFGFNVGLEAGQILVVLIILLISRLFLGLLNVKVREWVIFISAAVFGLALKMALERLPL